MDVSRLYLSCLDPATEAGDVARLVRAASADGYAGVRVWPLHVKTAREASVEAAGETGRKALVRASASHPLGAVTPMMRSIECTQAAKAGADEIEVSAPLSALLAEDPGEVVDTLLMSVKSVRSVLRSMRVFLCLQTPLLRGRGMEEGSLSRAVRVGVEGARFSGCDGVTLATSLAGWRASAADVGLVRGVCAEIRIDDGGAGGSEAEALALLEGGAASATLRADAAPDRGS